MQKAFKYRLYPNKEQRKACGFAADRDVNAAKNILTLGASDVILTKSQ